MENIPASLRMRAWVCRLCPLCIGRRAFPESGYARWMRKVERNCPFCKAYDRLRKLENGASPSQDRQQKDQDQ